MKMCKLIITFEKIKGINKFDLNITLLKDSIPKEFQMIGYLKDLVN